jgi:hypothetical protein
MPEIARLCYFLGLAVLLAGGAVPVVAQDAAPQAEVGQPPELVAIDYKVLYREMMRLGMVSQVLGYTLTIDTDGRTTDCSFSRRYKNRYTRDQLCKAFRRATTFRPARDAQGNPVIGTYDGEIEIASFFQPSR